MQYQHMRTVIKIKDNSVSLSKYFILQPYNPSIVYVFDIGILFGLKSHFVSSEFFLNFGSCLGT